MKSSNLWWGIILIVMGILFMLDNMDVLDFGDTIRIYWPVFLVAWGIQLVFRTTSAKGAGEPIGQSEQKN